MADESTDLVPNPECDLGKFLHPSASFLICEVRIIIVPFPPQSSAAGSSVGVRVDGEWRAWCPGGGLNKIMYEIAWYLVPLPFLISIKKIFF